MKSLILLIFCLINLSLSSTSIAGGCESGMSQNDAYAAALQSQTFFKTAIASPKMIEKVESEADLQYLMKRLNTALKWIERTDREYVGCLNKTYNTMLARDMRFDHGAKSGDELIQKAMMSIKEAKALYPVIQEQLKQASLQRQKDIKEAELRNKEAQEQLKREQQEIAQLEASIKKEKQLQMQLKHSQEKRLSLEAELIDTESKTKIMSDASRPMNSIKKNTNIKNETQRGNGYLKKDSLFCLSKQSFDRQFEYLARDQMKFASGCYSTPTRQNVWLKDISMFSGTCIVERISDERTLWISCESFQQW